jgi:hypothetical protein
MQLSSAGPALTPDEKGLIQGTLNGDAQPQWNIYFSRVRFASTLTGSGPFVYTIAPQTVQAFGYGVGQSATAGGLGTALASDTSLQNAQQTMNSEFVLIRGIGLMIAPWSDPLLAKQLEPQTSVNVTIGPTTYKLGTPTMLPGPGGFVGWGESQVAYPSPLEVAAKGIGGFSNGQAIAGNYLKLPRALVWVPQGAGSTSNLIVTLQSFATATLPANFEGPADRTAEAQSSSFTGTNAWTHPTAANTFVDFVCILDHVPFYTQ